MTIHNQLLAVAKQIVDFKLDDSDKITITLSKNNEAVVLAESVGGVQLFVQSADRTRLCRAHYVRDGKGT